MKFGFALSLVSARVALHHNWSSFRVHLRCQILSTCSQLTWNEYAFFDTTGIDRWALHHFCKIWLPNRRWWWKLCFWNSHQHSVLVDRVSVSFFSPENGEYFSFNKRPWIRAQICSNQLLLTKGQSLLECHVRGEWNRHQCIFLTAKRKNVSVLFPLSKC